MRKLLLVPAIMCALMIASCGESDKASREREAARADSIAKEQQREAEEIDMMLDQMARYVNQIKRGDYSAANKANAVYRRLVKQYRNKMTPEQSRRLKNYQRYIMG